MNARLILGAAVAASLHVGMMNPSAEAFTTPPSLGLIEPSELLFCFDMVVTYNPSGGVGTLTGSLDPLGSFITYEDGTSTLLEDPNFNLTMQLDLVTSAVINGNLEVGGDLDGVGNNLTLFFSSTKPLFGMASNKLFEFVFIQQDKPITNEFLAGIGGEIGIFISLNTKTFTPDVAFSDTALIKIFGTDGFIPDGDPVPEPLTAGLAMTGLAATGLALTRRRMR